MKVKYYEIRFNSFPDIVPFEKATFETITSNEYIAKAFCKENTGYQYKEIEVDLKDEDEEESYESEKFTITPKLKEIFKKFEDLGWTLIKEGYTDSLVLKKVVEERVFGDNYSNANYYITINYKSKTYNTHKNFCFNTSGFNISMDIYKLLGELFEECGWI